MEDPAAASENLTTLVPISSEKMKQDSLARQQYEVDLEQKLSELHSVRERLYQLRFDYSRPEADIEIDVKNLAGEYNRLQRDISKTMKREIKTFEDSLALHELNLPPLLSSKKSQAEFVPAAVRLDPSLSISSKDQVDEHETMEDVPEDITLMRTKSTQNLEDKTPQEKWQGLFRMFKEWKHQKNVAEASQIMRRKKPEKAMVENEIIKLRTTIYSMRQRKTLSKSDQNLMQSMTQNLNTLTKRSLQLNQLSSATTTTTSSTSSQTNQTVSPSDVTEQPREKQSKK